DAGGRLDLSLRHGVELDRGARGYAGGDNQGADVTTCLRCAEQGSVGPYRRAGWRLMYDVDGDLGFDLTCARADARAQYQIAFGMIARDKEDARRGLARELVRDDLPAYPQLARRSVARFPQLPGVVAGAADAGPRSRAGADDPGAGVGWRLRSRRGRGAASSPPHR